MSKKVVTKIEYAQFVWDYNNKRWPQLRYGQAFINEFYSKIRQWMPDPDVFYERDNEKAKYYVETKYVE